MTYIPAPPPPPPKRRDDRSRPIGLDGRKEFTVRRRSRKNRKRLVYDPYVFARTPVFDSFENTLSSQGSRKPERHRKGESLPRAILLTNGIRLRMSVGKNKNPKENKEQRIDAIRNQPTRVSDKTKPRK